MDLISVIVPVYRVEKYIDQCIWSLRNQTYKNIEIILVDDGSDDQCPQICEQHAGQDRRIKIIHKKNGGADSARKAGMLAATGKYVGYVDGDDWIEPEMYEKLLAYAEEYGVDVVESGIIDSGENLQRNRHPYLGEGCYKDRIFDEKILPRLFYSGYFYEYGILAYLCTKLFLKEKIMKYHMMGGKANRILDDAMIGLPCVAETKSLYITHDCYYHYRIRTDSSKSQVYQEEMVVADLFECYPDFLARFKGTGLADTQLHYFTLYWLLYKAPGVFDHMCKDDFLVPFGNIGRGKKIVLYGAGASGVHLERYIRSTAGGNIVGWADRNYRDLQKTLNIIAPHEIPGLEYDYIIISILKANAVQGAKKDLMDMGVPENKILWIEQKYLDDPRLLFEKVVYLRKTLAEVVEVADSQNTGGDSKGLEVN